MLCRIPLQCLIVGLSLMFVSGCSLSRGNQASRASSPAQTEADDLSDEEPIQTASAEAAADGDAPPPQPGVKAPGGSRKKLAGWLQNGDNSDKTVKLDRTDKSKSAEVDAEAEEDAGWWKHQQETTASAAKASTSKSANDESLSLSSSNPFEK